MPTPNWKSRLVEAFAAHGAAPVLFQTWTKHQPELTARNGQPVQLLAPIVEACDKLFDEEALPFVRVRAADGAEFVAGTEELFSHDATFLTLLEAIDGPFFAARELGFVGPTDLVDAGDATALAAFDAMLTTFQVSSCAQGDHTPEAYRCVAPQWQHETPAA